MPYPTLWVALLRLRTYPDGFALQLLESYRQHLCGPARRDLRFKPQRAKGVNEVEQFTQLPFGDCWEDGDLLGVFDYLMTSKKVRTPWGLNHFNNIAVYNISFLNNVHLHGLI